MSTLGKDAEHQIMRAMDKVAELVETGKTPNEAIIKVAGDYQLRPGYIKVLVHAYNTGSTTRQREGSDDLFDKSAEFTLADADHVMEALFPKHVKTAAELHHETAVSLDYGISPDGIIDRHNKKLAALARQVDFSVEKPPPRPAAPFAELKKTARLVERGRKDVDEARRVASNAFDKAAGLLYELREYFRQPGCLKFAYVRETAELLDGPQIAKACDHLQELYPTLKKHAGIVPQRIDMHAEPFRLMRKLAEAMKTYVQLQSDFETLEEKIGAAVEAVHRPFVHAPASKSVLDEPSSTKRGSFVWNPFTQMILGGAAKDAITGVSGKLGPVADDSLKNDTVAELTDPNHEAMLKNIRSQATLHDLMVNDPVISGYPQHETLAAFNDIANLSPRSVDQRAILQTMLRQRLAQGQLSNFELDQALGMEQKLKQREGGASVQSVI